MTSFLRAAALTAVLLPALAAMPSQAAQREPFEMVKDWEIERTVGDTSANPCLMSRTYKDKDDNNAVNGIVFALDGSNSALALVYQGWEWDKDETVKASLLAGKKILKSKVSWAGDAETLTSAFPDTIVPDLLSAKTITLRFEDGDAEFDITGFPQAYESLRRCDATPAKAPAPAPAAKAPAPAAPSPAAAAIAAGAAAAAPKAPAVAPAAPAAAAAPVLPAQPRIQTYAFGLMLQQMLKECDVATTGKQRTAIDEKVASLQPEMVPLESALRERMKAEPLKCPSATDEAKVQTTMKDFVDLSPEGFSEAMDKKAAESAAAKAEPKADPKVEAPATEAPKQ